MKQLAQFYFHSFTGLSVEVWWLALITLINRAGAMVIPFLSLYLTEDLHLSLAQVGWVMSAFGLGSVIGSWLGGKLTDQIGAYKVMVYSLILSGILFLALQWISGFYLFCAGILLLTTVTDSFRPAIFVALRAYSKPENTTRSVTLIRLAINLGFSAGPALGGFIITHFSYSGLFWVDGVTCILAGLLITVLLNPKRAPVKASETPENPQSVYSDSTYLIFVFAVFLFAVVFLQYFSTIPLFYKNGHHLAEWQIGLLFAMNGLLIFLFEMPLIKALERTKLTKVSLTLIGTALIGASFIILTFTNWVGILVISILLVTIGEMIAFPFSNTYAMERANRGKSGQYMGLYIMAFSVGHIVSHNAGMQLVSGIGFESTWYIVTVISAFSLLLLFELLRRDRKENEKLSETE